MMIRAYLRLCLLCGASCLVLAGCGQRGTGGAGELPPGGTDGTNGNSARQDGGSTSTGLTPAVDGTPQNSDSVAYVTTDGAGGLSGSTRPKPDDGVTARIRNESASRADVTLRFIEEETITYLAFIRVLPGTVTTVVSPSTADRIELSGIDERGRPLTGTTLVFGVDFDRQTPAEYVIAADGLDEPQPSAPNPGAPSITMVEPAADLARALGSTLLARWNDSGDTPGAVVRVSLRPEGATSSADLIPVGPAIGAALDGINDELSIVLEDLEPGTYEVVGEIDDGVTVVTSVAPGRVEVLLDRGNAAPSLVILSPAELTELRGGDLLAVEWSDEDEDDNAIITFQLTAAEPTGVAVGPFRISPPFAEDPDGNGADEAVLTITGVLPGLYDLVGLIDDGRLAGTARVERIVRILPEPENDPPQLVLIEPAADVELARGQSFEVTWTDVDENDNAQISLMLDPDLDSGALDGNEVLLVSSLGEDDDGPADSITIGIPTGVEKAEYRLAGAITDGVAEVVTWAPGNILFGITEPALEPPALTLSKPREDIRTRLGGDVPFLLETANIPPGADVRLYLSNMAYGGAFRGDVTPGQPVLDQETELTLPSSTGAIPNDAWPRRFDLIAELEADGAVFASVAPGSVWIRQEVEVTSVDMVNYTCSDTEDPVPDDRGFIGLEVKWRGGGFEQREPHAEVKFWLSLADDGTVPEDGVEDGTHRIIHRALESPHMNRTADLSLPAVIGFPGIRGEELRATLEPGVYRLITVVESEDFGRIISPPHPDAVDICLDYRVPDTGR